MVTCVGNGRTVQGIWVGGGGGRGPLNEVSEQVKSVKLVDCLASSAGGPGLCPEVDLFCFVRVYPASVGNRSARVARRTEVSGLTPSDTLSVRICRRKRLARARPARCRPHIDPCQVMATVDHFGSACVFFRVDRFLRCGTSFRFIFYSVARI